MTHITILGAGAMASAISVPLVKNGHEVRIWGTEFDRDIIGALKAGQPHPALKTQIKGNFFYDNELETALKDSEIVVFGVLSSAARSIAQKAKPFLANQIVINVAKGFDNCQTMIEVLEQELPNLRKVTVAGPSIAAEVAQEQKTQVVFASKEKSAAKLCKKVFQTKNYRVEVSIDVVGEELCSALKNVYAIAINLGTNNNHKSALFAQSLAEIAKFVKAFGGKSKTVYGLAGLGDLHVTSQGGRNGMLGQAIASGRKASEVLSEFREKNIIIEGYAATKAAYELAKAKGMKLPLLKEVHAVLYESKQFSG